MTLTFESDQHVLVYALEKIKSFARNNQYIFLAQSVWWISSIIGLQEGLIIHIDNLRILYEITEKDLSSKAAIESEPSIIHQSRVDRIQHSNLNYSDSKCEPISTTETNIHNENIHICEALLQQSQQESKTVGRFSRQKGRAISSTPRDLKEEPRNKIDSQNIHPDRIGQVDSSGSTEHLDSVLKETEHFLRISQTQWKRFDPLRRTRQGKIQPRKLAKKERKRLNKIIQESPDLVRKFSK
jgi:hypothetical protein